MTDAASSQSRWWNYKQAGELPPEAVERMWRTLSEISECASIRHPGHVDFVSKDQIAAMARKALPTDADMPRGFTA